MTWPFASRMPSPLSSMPQLFEMMVRSLVPLRRIAAIRFSGMPHSPKPPAIIVAPSKRSATASSALGDGLVHRAVNHNASPCVVRYCARRHRMPIVTFTTDFGAGDGYAGAMKGVVLSLAPQAQLVDITHGVPAQDVAAGAVALAQAAPLFPPGTIHIAVVDPGVGRRARRHPGRGGRQPVRRARQRRAVAGGAAAAPDLPHRSVGVPARAGQPDVPRARRVRARRRGAWRPARTPTDAGPSVDNMVEIGAPPLHKQGGVVEGQVIHIDASATSSRRCRRSCWRDCGPEARGRGRDRGRGDRREVQPGVRSHVLRRAVGRADRLHRLGRPAGDRASRRFGRQAHRRGPRRDRAGVNRQLGAALTRTGIRIRCTPTSVRRTATRASRCSCSRAARPSARTRGRRA